MFMTGEVKNKRFGGEFRGVMGAQPPPFWISEVYEEWGGGQGLLGAESSPPGQIPVYAP